ncbi:MAG: SgcJ/EcaC family oxidoreductase [Acidimicrobiales bacterium]
MQAKDAAAVRELYEQLMKAWNDGSGSGFAATFTADGDLVAFDGTHFSGREEIARSQQELFDKWMKGTRLVGSVERLRFVGPNLAIMHAIGGTIPRRRTTPARERASIQTLVAIRSDDGWLLAAFHNTRIRPIGRSPLTFLIWTIGDRLWRLFRLSTDATPVR